MKKFMVMCVMCLMALVAVGSVASALEDPYLLQDGTTVAVPKSHFEVSALGTEGIENATHDTGWQILGDKASTVKAQALKPYKLPNGDIAFPKMVNQRFHPVKLDKAGKPAWLKIEDLGVAMEGPDKPWWLDISGNSPCYKLPAAEAKRHATK